MAASRVPAREESTAYKQNRGPGGARRSVENPRRDNQVRGFSDSNEVSVHLRHWVLSDVRLPPNGIRYGGTTRSTATPAAVATM